MSNLIMRCSGFCRSPVDQEVSFLGDLYFGLMLPIQSVLLSLFPAGRRPSSQPGYVRQNVSVMRKAFLVYELPVSEAVKSKPFLETLAVDILLGFHFSRLFMMSNKGDFLPVGGRPPVPFAYDSRKQLFFSMQLGIFHVS